MRAIIYPLAVAMSLISVSCAPTSSEVVMISTADPAMVQTISEETAQLNLKKAMSDDIRAMDILIAYYLDKGMTTQAEYWEGRREITAAKSR